MTTEPCKDCDKPVSRTASQCPYCTRYLSNGLGILIVRVAMFTLVALYIVVVRMP